MRVKKMENKLKLVLYFTDDEMRKVRENYKVNEDLIDENVEILRNWIRQQHHLPQNQDRYLLERILLRNKFCIEETKKKLENYYTLRRIYREFQTEDNEFFIPSQEVAILVPCPKLTIKQERVFYGKLQNYDPKVYSFRKLLSYYFIIFELVMRNDYSMGDRIIYDLNGMSLSHMKKLYPTLIFKALKFYRGALSSRLLSLDLINAPSYVTILLSILKIALPRKLYNRIKVHRDFESLAQTYTKAYLPKDYGGDLPSIRSLNEQWDLILKEHYDFLNENYYNVSDESLRASDTLKKDFYGIEGTFRKITLD